VRNVALAFSFCLVNDADTDAVVCEGDRQFAPHPKEHLGLV
jgi:hypothetical protein